MDSSALSTQQINNFIEHFVLHENLGVVFEQVRDAFETSGLRPVNKVITGPPGAGKTATLAHLKDRIVTDIGADESSVPVLSIRLKGKPTDIGLMKAMLKELGLVDLKYGFEDLFEMLIKNLRICGVAVIFIDEYQQLIRKDTHVNVKICDLIKAISDISKVSFVLSGVKSGLKLFTLDDQLQSRFSDHIEIPFMKITKEDDIGYFSNFLDELMLAFPMKSIKISTSERAHRLLLASGGSLRRLRYIIDGTLIWNRAFPDKKLEWSDYHKTYLRLHGNDKVRTRRGQHIDPFTSTLSSVKRQIRYAQLDT